MTDTLSVADSLIQRGIVDFQQGHLESAINLFTGALQHNSASVCAYANRATAYYAKGSYQQALNDLSRALGDFAAPWRRELAQRFVGRRPGPALLRCGP